MNDNHENMDKLLSSLLDTNEAARTKQDIQLGDKIINGFTSPEPDPVVVSKIKTRISVRLTQRNKFRTAAWRATAAAVIIIVTAIGARFIGNDNNMSKNQQNVAAIIWNDDILTSLAGQIEEIESDMLNIRLDEYGSENGEVFIELEHDIAEINGEFWKG